MPSEEDWNKIRSLESDRAYWQQELRDVYEAESRSGNTLDGSSSIPRRLEEIDREIAVSRTASYQRAARRPTIRCR